MGTHWELALCITAMLYLAAVILAIAVEQGGMPRKGFWKREKAPPHVTVIDRNSTEAREARRLLRKHGHRS